MSIASVNAHAQLVPLLARTSLLQAEPFTLIDVGCSGGIEPYWRLFEPALRATGVDPMVTECDRLRSAEQNPHVRYVPAWIRQPGFPADKHAKTDQPFARTSAWTAIGQMTPPNAPATPVELAHRRLTLDELVDEANYGTVDFIKIDTDGDDLEVLASAERTLQSKQVLGVEVEWHFQGGMHPWANTFDNMHRVLRGAGLSFFDQDMRRYTRAALPGRFASVIPAETQSGQAIWANAVYLRDAGAPGYEADWPPLSLASIVKLVCLFELYGLNDCAAELILKHREAFDAVFSSNDALDILAREMWPDAAGYEEVMQSFREDPTRFYPANPFRPRDGEPPTPGEQTFQEVFRQAYLHPRE
jgi:FkbM family methyltransferase